MSRKYTPPKKKKKGIPQIARSIPSAAAPSASSGAAPVTEFSMARPPVARPAVKAGAIPDTLADSVKYASVPRELRRILLYTAAAIVLLIVLWLILR